MKSILNIFRKEFNSFFASPAAWLFLGGFLIVNLFIFFWANAFFARNIADMKPLFQWMPVLLVFFGGGADDAQLVGGTPRGHPGKPANQPGVSIAVDFREIPRGTRSGSHGIAVDLAATR